MLHVLVGWLTLISCGRCYLELSLNFYFGIQALMNVILAPFLAIIITGRNLFLHIIEDEPLEFAPLGLNLEAITGLKLFEHFFEALPQLILSFIYISNHGGLFENIHLVISSIFSLGSLVYGIIISCSTCFQIWVNKSPISMHNDGDETQFQPLRYSIQSLDFKLNFKSQYY